MSFFNLLVQSARCWHHFLWYGNISFLLKPSCKQLLLLFFFFLPEKLNLWIISKTSHNPMSFPSAKPLLPSFCGKCGENEGMGLKCDYLCPHLEQRVIKWKNCNLFERTGWIVMRGISNDFRWITLLWLLKLWKLHPLDMIRTLQIMCCCFSVLLKPFFLSLKCWTELVKKKFKKKNLMLYLCICWQFKFVLERNASANIHTSLLHVYHWFITLRRRQKPLKHLSSCTFISDDNLSACAYYVERGF